MKTAKLITFPGVRIDRSKRRRSAPKARGMFLDIKVTVAEARKVREMADAQGISFGDAAQRAFRIGLKTYKPLSSHK